MNYYIVFSTYEEGKFASTVIAKRYTEMPDERKKEFCDVFGFKIITEEEFNNIKAYKKVIL